MKTFMLKKEDQKNLKWYIVDANDQILGRLAVKIAALLRGKEEPNFTPHVDGGIGVIVVNAEKVKVTGNKLMSKRYHRHTGFPGGMRYTYLDEMLEKNPGFPITNAVKGMLPKNKTRKKLMTRLKVYAGAENPHAAQQAVKVEL